jgi:hypothetical protein
LFNVLFISILLFIFNLLIKNYKIMERRNFLLNFSGVLGGISAYPLFSSNSTKKLSNIRNSELQLSSRSEIMERIGKPLVIQPVLLYNLLERKEASTWREWGGLKTQDDVDNEIIRVNKELKKLKLYSDFSMDVLPLKEVNNDEKASQAKNTECDVILLYAAGTAGNRMYASEWIDLLTNAGKHVVIFLRHKTGPVYLWYEIAHTKLLRKASDKYVHKNLDIDDIVVDDYNKVLTRLRALYGLKNIQNTTIVAVNGIGSWGGHGDVVDKTINDIWHLNVIDVGIKDLVALIEEKQNNNSILNEAKKDAENYISQDSIVSVNTKKEFIVNTFILYYSLKDLMAKYGAEGVTIRGCMGVGKHVHTTPCLAFSLINDEGLMAFCESDFNVIPTGILLRHISGKPVFLNDPTFPHDGITTCAHCHSPRRMNGRDLEPTHIYTHCESDYGAAPKVEFRKGQVITNIIPNFQQDNWIGFRGKIIDHPFYDICRSQFDCTIDGDWEKLLQDMGGFHWMTCYGDYLKEISYVAKKAGIKFENISKQNS